MQVSDKLIKPLTEAKYLNADNVSRYRCIMRIFFATEKRLQEFYPTTRFAFLFISLFYSNSTITNQFCLEIICCRVRFSFNYLIYPYYPAYTG